MKLWSFEQQQCVATYIDHTQAVWGVAFHDLGDFVASCSLDHSARLWDVTTSKCRQSFRYAGFQVHVQQLHVKPSDACKALSDKKASCSLDHGTRLWDVTPSKL